MVKHDFDNLAWTTGKGKPALKAAAFKRLKNDEIAFKEVVDSDIQSELVKKPKVNLIPSSYYSLVQLLDMARPIP